MAIDKNSDLKRGKGALLFLVPLCAFSCFCPGLCAQPKHYTVANAHSHNDYEQKIPFWLAYNAGFGSIEADIFLVDSVLYVAHDRIELQRKIKLENEYLVPIQTCLSKNHGKPYAEPGKKLQMLIDIKADSVRTLSALILLLKKYPALIQNNSISWVITGNRPDQRLFSGYPAYILFDGELHLNYSTEALTKIQMMSDDFKYYTSWNGVHDLPDSDRAKISLAIKKAHDEHMTVRFWDAPDQPNSWKQLINLQVDYINTDFIQELSGFLK